MFSSRHLALGLLCAAALSGGLLAQARRSTPPLEVASFDDLRPKTTDQIVRSTAWSSGSTTRRLTDGESRRLHVFVHPEIDSFYSVADEKDPYGLRYRVCATSAVIVGKVTKAQSFLNVAETDLFTDFQISLDQRIRPATGDNTVQVSVGGGRVLVGGRTSIEVDHGQFLEVEQRYALLLRSAPQFKTHFLAWDPLPIAGGTVILPDGRLQPEATFLTTLLDFAKRCRN